MKILTTVLCLASFAAQAQREAFVAQNRLADSAEYLVFKGRYQEAVSLYEEIFTRSPSLPKPYFDAISACLSIGDTERANRFLSIGIQRGFVPEAFQFDTLLMAHLASEAAQEFRETRAENARVFAAHADSSLIKEIEAMYEADQAARRGTGYTDETRRVDSLNFERLIALVEKHGFPTERSLGMTVGSVHSLLWHHRPPVYPRSAQWQRMLPFIRAAMAKGDLGPAYLCNFDDMADFEEGKPQRYGTLLFYFNQYPDLIYLADRETLNHNRASVGLGPIEWSAEQAGLDLSKVRSAEP